MSKNMEYQLNYMCNVTASHDFQIFRLCGQKPFVKRTSYFAHHYTKQAVYAGFIDYVYAVLHYIANKNPKVKRMTLLCDLSFGEMNSDKIHIEIWYHWSLRIC